MERGKKVLDVQVAVFPERRDYGKMYMYFSNLCWWWAVCEGGRLFLLIFACVYQVCISVHIVDKEYIFEIIVSSLAILMHIS